MVNFNREYLLNGLSHEPRTFTIRLSASNSTNHELYKPWTLQTMNSTNHELYKPWSFVKIVNFPFNTLSTIHVNVREKHCQCRYGPHTCMFKIHLSQDVLCVPHPPETFADCAKSYTKPWSVHTVLKFIKKKKKLIKVALRACWTHLLLERVLRNFEFFHVLFWRMHCQYAQRKIPRQRVT